MEMSKQKSITKKLKKKKPKERHKEIQDTLKKGNKKVMITTTEAVALKNQATKSTNSHMSLLKKKTKERLRSLVLDLQQSLNSSTQRKRMRKLKEKNTEQLLIPLRRKVVNMLQGL